MKLKVGRKQQIDIFYKKIKIFKVEDQSQIDRNSACQQYFAPDVSRQRNKQPGIKIVK